MRSSTLQHSDDFIAQIPTQLYINGEWRSASDRGQIEVFDPSTEALITTVSSATVNDAEVAINAAHVAGSGWAETSPRKRAELLQAAYARMHDDRYRLATIISREEGKTLAEGLSEVAYAAEFFRWYAEESPRLMGQFGRSPSGDNHIIVEYVPVGVALLITPWNFPAAMATRKIAPALAAGCTVILKPASETPLTALAIAQILKEVGIPKGVVNVLPSSQSGKISRHILNDSRVTKLSFTGSTEVGRILLSTASESVVNCSMELGGNAPFIVLEDADIELAVEGAIVAKMRNAGESCIGANRFYVHESIELQFALRLAEEMAKLKVGPGLDKGVDVGPLVNSSTLKKVENLVACALSAGAELLTGGKPLDRSGFFYEPTVLRNIDVNADILNTEIFGPVAPIVSFSNIDEVIDLANNTIFGLAAYIFSGNVGRALRLAKKLDAGVIGINRGYVSDPAAPFGGMKQSGIGREGSQDGIHEFLEKKYIAVEW